MSRVTGGLTSCVPGEGSLSLFRCRIVIKTDSHAQESLMLEEVSNSLKVCSMESFRVSCERGKPVTMDLENSWYNYTTVQQI
jgi:hypothetical protein